MDIEAALVPVTRVRFALDVNRVLTSTPNNLQNILPVIKLLDTGGSGDEQALDHQGVEVDIYHNSKANASALAWEVYHWMMRSLPAKLGSAGVRRVVSGSLPIETSYENPGVWRYTFNVIVYTHDRSL